jgi:DNA-binding transcriptional LysR family regulator
MTLNQIRAFEAVSKYLNITRAAESLDISEPSVFKQVKSLEYFCGVRLYRKVGRQIELTREGRLVQVDVREILLRVERLGQRFKQAAPALNGGSLAVGGSHGPSVALIPSLLAAFKNSHPHTQIVFRTKSSRAVEQLVLQSRVELGVITNPSNSRLLHVAPYRQGKVLIVVSAKYPLAKQMELTIADLALCPLIIRKDWEGRASDILKQIESHGFSPTILMECDSGEAIKIAVMNGMGLGILHEAHVAPELKAGQLRVVKVAGLRQINSNIFIIYRKGISLSRNALDFMNLSREPRQRTGWNGALEKAS